MLPSIITVMHIASSRNKEVPKMSVLVIVYCGLHVNNPVQANEYEKAERENNPGTSVNIGGG